MVVRAFYAHCVPCHESRVPRDVSAHVCVSDEISDGNMYNDERTIQSPVGPPRPSKPGHISTRGACSAAAQRSRNARTDKERTNQEELGSREARDERAPRRMS